MPSRIAFSTLAFPDATLAAAVSAGRRWGYSGVELRLTGDDPGPDLRRFLQEKRWHPEIEEPKVALPQHLDLLRAWLESDL